MTIQSRGLQPWQVVHTLGHSTYSLISFADHFHAIGFVDCLLVLQEKYGLEKQEKLQKINLNLINSIRPYLI